MEDWLNIDDSDAIKNIRKKLPKELSELISDDEIEEIIDNIHAFFLENGFLEEEASDELIEFDEDALFEHVSQRLNKRAKEKLSDADIKLLIEIELDYSEFL